VRSDPLVGSVASPGVRPDALRWTSIARVNDQAFVHLPTDVPIGLIAEKHLIPKRATGAA